MSVRVVTNSLAATGVAAVHAGYAKRRQHMLRAGVRLFELKPHARIGSRARLGTRRMHLGSSAASLHGKTFSMDREWVFMGSFNIDPRSFRLNTEIGCIPNVQMSGLTPALSRQIEA